MRTFIARHRKYAAEPVSPRNECVNHCVTTNMEVNSGFPKNVKISRKDRDLKFVFQNSMKDSTNKGQGIKTFAACLLAGMTFLATVNAADFDVVVADSQATVYSLNPRTGVRTIIAQQDKLSCPYDVA